MTNKRRAAKTSKNLYNKKMDRAESNRKTAKEEQAKVHQKDKKQAEEDNDKLIFEYK